MSATGEGDSPVHGPVPAEATTAAGTTADGRSTADTAAGAGPPDEAPPAPPPPRRQRRLLFVAVVAVLALISAGGFSAYLLLRDTGAGAAEPVDAVRAFLQAAYVDQDATATADAVCPEARDPDAIAAKLDQIRRYGEQHAQPRFEWAEPRVTDRGDDTATVTVALTAVTRDERTAEQDLTFTVVRTDGWWVCDVA